MPTLDYNSREVKDAPRKTEPVREYGAYGEGIVYIFRAYDNPHSGEDIDYFANYFATPYSNSQHPVTLGILRDFKLGGFDGRQYRMETGGTPLSVPDSLLYVYLTKKHAYVVHVVGAEETHPCVEKFLKSFSLSSKPSGQQIVDDNTESLAASTPAAPPTPRADADQKLILQKGGDQGVRGDASAGGSQPENPVDYNRVFPPKDVTRKAIIGARPAPAYTEAARKHEITGTIRIRMVLAANGKVNAVAALTRLPDGLTESAIRAAHHVKFIPALKDGRYVSQYVTIDYNFNIY
ncbi:MAG: energy transducer TonB [Pyrinomonadaceae bacterium]